jgi:hypothetical protein
MSEKKFRNAVPARSVTKIPLVLGVVGGPEGNNSIRQNTRPAGLESNLRSRYETNVIFGLRIVRWGLFCIWYTETSNFKLRAYKDSEKTREKAKFIHFPRGEAGDKGNE